MIFYYMAAAILYSATRIASLGGPRCPNGHEASPFAKYCDRCGASIPPAPVA
jgi:hypothetical protein